MLIEVWRLSKVNINNQSKAAFCLHRYSSRSGTRCFPNSVTWRLLIVGNLQLISLICK
jgi:hypothetical protein